jgi:hypothetical protein
MLTATLRPDTGSWHRRGLRGTGRRGDHVGQVPTVEITHEQAGASSRDADGDGALQQLAGAVATIVAAVVDVREDIAYTDGVAYSCTTNDQPWSAIHS